MSGTTWMVVGVAFAALYIWLAVRIINRRERWAKWALATVIGVPALYPLSFGPVCWRASRPFANVGIAGSEDGHIPIVYWPICAEARKSSGTLAKAINWYATVGMSSDSIIWMPMDSIGFTWDIMSNVPGGIPIRPPATR